MGLYKVTGPTPVGDNEPGSTFEQDFSPADESDLLSRGRIQLLASQYRVLEGEINIDGQAHKLGESFEAALPAAQAASLIEGGNIEIVKAAPAKAAKAADAKADKPAAAPDNPA